MTGVPCVVWRDTQTQPGPSGRVPMRVWLTGAGPDYAAWSVSRSAAVVIPGRAEAERIAALVRRRGQPAGVEPVN